MKKKKITWTILLLALSAFLLPSCLDDDDNDIVYPSAVVTLKTNPTDGKFFMQLDDSTILNPTNMQHSPYGEKEVRAFVKFKEPETRNMIQKDVYVQWIDTIRTKNMAENLGSENANTYGKNPIEIVKHWSTVVEDGYLTIRFRTFFDNSGTIHYLNLVQENPFEVTLYHDAKGDVNGIPGDGMMAFRLDKLPDTEGKVVDLKLKWESYSGPKETTFKYRTRK